MIFEKKTINNYGIGKTTILRLLDHSGINKRNACRNLKLKQRVEIEKKVKNIIHGKKLRDNVKEVISFLSKIKTYKGIRHRLGYPVRGQRTHTNAKTKKSKF